MNLYNKPKIISAYRGMYKYIESVRNNPGSDLKKLWNEHVIEPYWNEWAAGTSVEERTREQFKYPITNINELESEVELLSSTAIEEIAENAYKQAYTNLPKDGEVVICIYALDPDNITVSEKQNGVVGTCIDGNILIQINPKVPNWKEWVSYVIAHEYHHSVWGYNYFYLRRNTRMDLLTGLIIEKLWTNFSAYAGETVVGNIMVFEKVEGDCGERVGFIENLYVLSDWQGHKIAKSLLVTALKYFQNNGMKKSQLDVWGRNKRAVQLYKSLGYVFVVEKEAYPGINL